MYCLAPGGECLSLPRVGQVLEEIVEDDAQPGELENVSKHGDWREILEIPDTGEQQHWQQDDQHVDVVVDLPVVVVEYLLQVLADKHKIHAAEAELGDAEEHIDDGPGGGSETAESRAAAGGEAGLGHIRVSEEGKAGAPAQLLAGVHQHVHRVDADGGHDYQAKVAHQQAAVLDRIGHGEDSGTQVSFQHVDDRISV